MVAFFFLLQQPTVLLPVESHHSSLINSCAHIWSAARAGTCTTWLVCWSSPEWLRNKAFPFWSALLTRANVYEIPMQKFCQVSVSLEHIEHTSGLVWSVIPGGEVLHRFRHFHLTPKKIPIRQCENISIVLYVSHLISRCAAVGMTDGYSCFDCVYILIWSNCHKTKEKEPCHCFISLLLQLVFKHFLFSGLTGDYPAAVTDSWNCRRLQKHQGKPQKI